MGVRKTLLLVFIHGFQGGDDTFGTFPEHLRALASHAQPHINVLTLTYPRYETRGELRECVARFREWLENKVIDLEVATGTPSPMIDPSVHTILLGHSMGGIVAAEALLAIASERLIPSAARANEKRDSGAFSQKINESATVPPHENGSATDAEPGSPGFMFPHVQGILAFDTPFLGLAPGMIAHGLEGGHKMASDAWSTYNDVASVLGWGSKPNSASPSGKAPVGALPAPPMTVTGDAAASPRWQSWGKYAMFAGAAGAVAAGGAAALYSQREKISAGWSWASSHLLFVGDLAKAERLKQRVSNVNKVCLERGIYAANFYTNLGKGAREGYGITNQLAGKDRTFCVVPKEVSEKPAKALEMPGMEWMKAVNEKAQDETSAHVSMFLPTDNPGYYGLAENAKEKIMEWIDQGWYQSSTSEGGQGENLNATINPEFFGKDWEGLDGSDDRYDEEHFQMRDEDKEDNDIDEEMEASIIVDKSPTSSMAFESKAVRGEVPLPSPKPEAL